MRAAVLQPNRELVVSDMVVDAPRGREVAVRVHACGLCHSDAHVLDGVLSRPLPMVLGHEAAGVVAAVGPDVVGLSVGDRVVTCLVMGCGSCARCAAHEPTLCLNAGVVKRAAGEPSRYSLSDGTAVGQMANIGGLSELAIVDERGLVRIDDDIPFEKAAVLGCAVVTGVGAVCNTARVVAGETVAVIGCGGVGLSAIQGARIAGASRIIAVDLNDEKLELARRAGATDVVNGRECDPVEMVRSLTGEGVDHAFEVVGSQRTVRQAFDMAANGRNAYALGIHPDDAEIAVPAMGIRRGKSLVGVFMGDTVPSADIARYITFWREGRLDLHMLVSDVVPLEGAAAGFARMAAGAGARTVVSLAP